MTRRLVNAVVVFGAMLLTGACATSQEWADWKAHPTHFASGEHFAFSLRNRAGTEPRVTRPDIEVARAQEWWGKSITVSSEQIIQR